MSILLDAIQKQKDSGGGDLDLAADNLDELSRFDQQLQRSRNFWRGLSLLLIVVLSLSWLWFLWPWSPAPGPDERAAQAAQQVRPEHKPIESNGVADNETQVADAKHSDANRSGQRKVYRPQAQRSATAGENKPAPVKTTQPEVESESSAQIFTLDELPEAARSAFPPLTINSYVLADDETKSFVVINNQIYGKNEMLAPKTKLLAIRKGEILILFDSYRVKLPLD